ncbi:MAG: alpha-ketoacid dehydrogenase subunit beta [Rhodospirillales bacterium]|nr:alpha-ketoacid dehydrogenase subunit beta [Rhodospirillales bacterium]
MGTSSIITFSEAINAAQRQAMELDDEVFLYGLGVDRTSGIFGSTTGLKELFGEKRVFDGPVSEQALTALAAGAAVRGMRPILVHQRLDFMMYSLDQIVNWISLWRFKSSGKSTMPLVIRAIVGKGWGQGPQHAKSLHTWFAHLPGLQVVMPSSPSEAKGLLLSSIFSDAPTIFIEGRSEYSMTESVPDEPYFIRLGKALIRKEGADVTIVSFGSMIPTVLRAHEDLVSKGVSADVIDLRTLAPLDMETVLASVKKTGRLVVAEPGWQAFGAAAEIVSSVAEAGHLRSPPRRVAWPNSHIPMSSPLEQKFYPTVDDVVMACMQTIGAPA